MERDFSVNKVQACFQFQRHERAGADAGKMPNVFILARRGVSSVFCLQKKVNAHVLALPSMRATGSVTSPLSGGDRRRRPKGHHCTEDALVWAGPRGLAAAEWAPLWRGLQVLCFQLLSCSQGLCSNFKASRNQGCTS